MNHLITILGPTASGKTRLATQLAAQLHAEIISADSRQVYKGMDLGTGKDLEDFVVHGRMIPYHLINIVDPSVTYHLNHYQEDFKRVYQDILKRNKQAILVGGSGLYLEAVLKDYAFSHIPDNPIVRKELATLDQEALIEKLNQINSHHINFDTTTTKRLVRAIEICHYLMDKPIPSHSSVASILFGVEVPRPVLLRRIHQRLIARIRQGMIEEVEFLLQKGISPEKLIYFGLEYKFVTQYLQKEMAFEEMVEKLNIAIRQFAKRQMTWFRRMERNDFTIHWIDGCASPEDQLREVLGILADKKL